MKTIQYLCFSLFLFVLGACDNPSILSNNANNSNNNANNTNNANNSNNANNANNANHTTTCNLDLDCPVTHYCNPCAYASCDGCTDCIAGCLPHNCATETKPVCTTTRPECGESGVAVVADRCWSCVDLLTCEPWRDTSCDDGTEVLCSSIPPQCKVGEILAIQDNCWICVNPSTCLPWGVAECFSDRACANHEYCNPWGSSACPICAQAVSACSPSPCDTGQPLTCNLVRPDCGPGNTAVVAENGCWECRSIQTCEALTRDAHCDDGTEITCLTFTELVCNSWEILAIQNECGVCVNPVTCLPWGIHGCENDNSCGVGERCEHCVTSSCPDCDDCVSACVVHGCPSELEALCDMLRPECGPDAVSVVMGGCWVCVDPVTCNPVTI